MESSGAILVYTNIVKSTDSRIDLGLIDQCRPVIGRIGKIDVALIDRPHNEIGIGEASIEIQEVSDGLKHA